MSNAKSFKDEWTVIQPLGSGGQANTLLVHKNSDKSAIGAAKILNKQKDEGRRARTYREAAALASLKHDLLPKLVDSNTEHFEDKDYNLFIVTEFIEGHVLAEVDFISMPLEHKIMFFKRLLEVINYCHQQGVMHRDIKPDNIILRRDQIDQPVLIDFGLSFNSNENDADNLTPSGEQIGNRFLSLPEQKVGEAAKRDFKSDISCAIGIFFYVITGIFPAVLVDEHNRKPHQREKAQKLLEEFPKHQKDILNNLFDVGFEPIIHRRWQSVQSVIDQIQIFETSKPPEKSDSETFIKSIREKSNTHKYSETRFFYYLFKELDNQIRSVLTDLPKQLGNDWSSIQSGGPLGPTEYKNHFAPYNEVLNFKGETIIRGFITGNELVIHIQEGKSVQEVMREPIERDINWPQFRERLNNHYLEQIYKVV